MIFRGPESAGDLKRSDAHRAQKPSSKSAHEKAARRSLRFVRSVSLRFFFFIENSRNCLNTHFSMDKIRSLILLLRNIQF